MFHFFKLKKIKLKNEDIIIRKKKLKYKKK